ncbi:hypothetical protein WA158_007754 [Blastocystis sp. Blastoise]
MESSSRAKDLVARRKRLEELRALRNGFSTAQTTAVTTSESIDNLVKEIKESAPKNAVEIEKLAQNVETVSSIKSKLDSLKEEENLISLSIPPTIVERYQKTIQTKPIENETVDENLFDPSKEFLARQQNKSKLRTSSQGISRRSQMYNSLDSTIVPKENTLSSIVDDSTRRTYLSSSSLNEFVISSSRIVERVLSNVEEYDPLNDYTQDINKLSGGNEQLNILGSFYADSICRKRAVTSIDWSPHHKELFLASYNQQLSDSEQWNSLNNASADGCICIWNMNMPTRYESIFTSSSPVLCAAFHPYNSYLLYGGCYNGKLLMWDVRQKAIPINKSDIRKSGHTHPIYSIGFTGPSSSCNIITASTDGTVCLWNPEQIIEPNYATPLTVATSEKSTTTTDVGVTCLSVPDTDSSYFYVGSEDGKLHSVQIGGNKASITNSVPLHTTPILSMSSHPNKTNQLKVLGDLLLTCSMDWTVKLWRPSCGMEPLYTFETSRNYVYGVHWSPSHPSLFASSTGNGNVELWNIADSVEHPVTTKKVSERAINCIKFNENGRKIACGDSAGYIHLLDVKAETAEARADELARLQQALDSMNM